MAQKFLTPASHQAVTTSTIKPTIYAADALGQSDFLNLGGSSITGILIPAGWTAANLAFLVIPSGEPQGTFGTYVPLYNQAGTRYILPVGSLPVSAPIYIIVNPYDFIGVDALVIQSVSTSNPATPVQQAIDIVLHVATIANNTF